MNRSRQLSELAHRLNNVIAVERISDSKGNANFAVTHAMIEIEMLQADLAYRKSLAQLKALMGK